jgi:hypothetical protein
MHWIVATPEGNRTVPVDAANIEALTGGGLTAEQVAGLLAKLPSYAVPAYYAAAMSQLPAGTMIALYRAMNYDTPDDKWPFWPAVLDPRPNQEETPDGSGGIRLVEIPEERRGPAPEPVEWWADAGDSEADNPAATETASGAQAEAGSASVSLTDGSRRVVAGWQRSDERAVFALCEDGSFWRMWFTGGVPGAWQMIGPSIPTEGES